MSPNRLVLLFATSMAVACSNVLLREQTSPVDEKPVNAAELNQECSNLRANIASSQYQRRNSSATTSSPVIAEAAEAKAEQKIDAQQKRYESLGCALAAPNAATGGQ